MGSMGQAIHPISDQGPRLADIPELVAGLASFASAFQQTARILKLRFASASGIPENLFLPHRLTGEEAVNEGMRFELEVLSSDARIELKTLLGVPVEITILTDAGPERRICGLVAEARQEGSDGGFATYRLTVESGLEVLRHRVAVRVFNELDVRALTSRILGEHLQDNAVLAAAFALEDRCRRTYPARPFWMQYHESDAAYLKRIWAREGISFVIEPGKKTSAEHPQHTLVLFDDVYDLDPDASGTVRFHRADGTEDRDAITQWRGHREIQSGSLSRHVWDHGTAASRQADEEARSDQGGHGQALASTLNDYRDTPSLEGDAPERHGDLAQRRMQARDGRTKRFEGEGTVRTFRPGTWFTLTQHPIHDRDAPQDREFVITRLAVDAVNNLPKDFAPGLAALLRPADTPADTTPEPPYTNHFTCLRRGLPLVAEEIPPPIPGLLTARVTGTGGDVHTDGLGRIRIRFLFSEGQGDDAESTWVRQAEAWSSQGFGANFVPRVGDEVVVQFLGNDPDKPIVTGCVHNGTKRPASFSQASALPLDKALSGFRSQEHGGLAGNELVFDDTTNELRARLASDHEKTELNLGHLAHPRRGGVADPRGEGFELRTGAWGAVRAERGLLLSTDGRPGAAGHHGDAKDLTERIQAALELSKALSDHARNQQAEPLTASGRTQDLKKTAEATKRHPDGETVAAFGQPILGLSSPAGIAEGTPGTIVKSTGRSFHVTTGQDTNLAVGRKLVMAIQDAWSVVAKGIKLFAGKGDVAIQAHEGSIQLTAEKDLKLIACNQGIEMAAPDRLLLAAGGASFELSSGTMTAKCTKLNIKAKYNLITPKPKSYDMPSLRKVEDVYDRHVTLIDDETGEPLPNMAYELTTESGQILRGITDAMGRTCKTYGSSDKVEKIKIFE